MTVQFPGFVDIQVNGFAGIDFNTPDITAERVREAIAKLRETGVTRFLPTLITGPFDRFHQCVRAILEVDDPAIVGIHMEGPYISPTDGPRGAHPREHTVPATMDDFLRRRDAANGKLRLVTLAPEVPGALELIEHMAGEGIRVAIGHSDAPPEIIRDAISAGATLSTHIGNGCASMLPRHHNVLWEQLAADELHASVISDGHHLPGAMVKVIVRAKGPRRTILVTDAIAAAGSPPGHYRLGDVEIELGADRRVSLRGTPYLAGSALTLPEAIGHAVRFTGLPLDEVLPMASTIPAEYLGIATAGTVTANWNAEAHQLTIRTVES